MLSKKKLIVILGVQRSGTSALTKALPIFDVSLGNNLLSENELVNPTGFWEDFDFLRLNIEILEYLNISWTGLKIVQLSDFSDESLKYFYNKAIDLLEQKTNGLSLFALKDPRITKLFCFWDYVFNKCGVDYTYIISIRDPNAIVDSFNRLNGKIVNELECNKYFVYNLILSYLLSIKNVFKTNNFYLVNYKNLLENTEGVIASLSKKLGIDINKSELDKYIDSFLNHSLDHSKNNQLTIEDGLLDKYYSILLNIESNCSVLKDEENKNIESIYNTFLFRENELKILDISNKLFNNTLDNLNILKEKVGYLMEENENLKLDINRLENENSQYVLRHEFHLKELTKRA